MDSNTNSQTKARVIVVSVFVIGFVAGALALNLYQRLTSSSNKDMPRNGTEFLIRRMNDKVGLTSAQQEQIKRILRWRFSNSRSCWAIQTMRSLCWPSPGGGIVGRIAAAKPATLTFFKA